MPPFLPRSISRPINEHRPRLDFFFFFFFFFFSCRPHIFPLTLLARWTVSGTMGLATADPEIAAAIGKELARQRDKIELIASENIASRAVLEAAGSVFTNKYAEGYPGKRYYGGCDYADVVETLAIDRARQLFGCNFANVQPNSGSQMNQAVFLALLNPGDTFMGLDLNSGADTSPTDRPST